MLAALLAMPATVVQATAAQAAFPGENGVIAFSSSNGIETIRADGSDRTTIGPGSDPAWSPDGTKIVYYSPDAGDWGGLATMTASGTPRTECPCSGFNEHFEGAGIDRPTWSPDGFRIAFAVTYQITDQTSWTVAIGVPGGNIQSQVDAFIPGQISWSANNKIWWTALNEEDGGGDDIRVWPVGVSGPTTELAMSNASGAGLSVSPDGSRVAFGRDEWGTLHPREKAIYRMQADGTGVVRLSGPAPASDSFPAWSPDGTKIAFVSNRDGNPELYVMNADGSNQTRITNTPGIGEGLPDWQPIPSGYPRPKSATPTYVPMVVAYGACGSATKVHAAPLGWGSCAAQQSSGQLTVGTPDANSACQTAVAGCASRRSSTKAPHRPTTNPTSRSTWTPKTCARSPT